MRKMIDCRKFPSKMKCTVAMAADNERELLDAAVQHAVAVHQHDDTPQLRAALSEAFTNATDSLSLR